jgi:alpha-amylase
MNDPQIHLCLVLHNHQPVGNFDDVFEAAYQDSYLPFLEVFEPFSDLAISLHTSGPLMQWMQTKHPDYLSRIASLVEAGRIEIIGGAFYEAILPMIPVRDRIGQIKKFSQWLEQRVCPQVHGMWMPERVWESNLASAIADAGIHYTVLDDYHFRRAGLASDQLYGDYVVEDEGRVVRVFPGSERLRYLIPFSTPQETIDYCRSVAHKRPGGVLVFGDDGEKFGTWPNTQKHVYQDGWLKDFFQGLTDNREWLKTTTLATAVQATQPLGKIYLPDCSYREMTEWSLPVQRQTEQDELVHQLEGDPRWKQIQSFMSGGFWRNFKIKYPETNVMYSRMMYVSNLLQEAISAGVSESTIEAARDHLYQGQCNCSYWHGAFGGIYLPHLRNAVYQHLLFAENLLRGSLTTEKQWVNSESSDFNFDGRLEVRLANDQLAAWVSPHAGGHLYELDLMKIGHNLGATLARRNEAYHAKVRQGEHQSEGEAASIHDLVVFKQEDLDKRLQYDTRMRNSLIDHFWDEDVSLDALMNSDAMERGDFADGDYTAKIRRNPDRIQVMLTREGNAWGVPLKMTKGLTLSEGRDEIEIAYLIEGLPKDRSFRFAIEFNFAGLPDGQDNRFFSDGEGNRLGHLGEKIELSDAREISLTDQWLGLRVALTTEQDTTLWAYPVQAVSQSESGFELVHQAVCVQPSWIVQGDVNGRWSARMKLKMQTEVARHFSAGDEAMSVARG